MLLKQQSHIFHALSCWAQASPVTDHKQYILLGFQLQQVRTFRLASAIPALPRLVLCPKDS